MLVLVDFTGSTGFELVVDTTQSLQAGSNELVEEVVAGSTGFDEVEVVQSIQG